ncbi:hypothetical protein [Photobacterium iliopiscarium]|jgi:hypothetical protein|uniref:hypothetical protein n=1 Tax=Photobacterium iliopiscarium TaxID=56192 RepID=UPI00242D8A39|nr:hypothetical protein [Photobacterium iliopiscarium]
MKQLNTYDTKEKGEETLTKIDELKELVQKKQNAQPYNEKKHREIITMLKYVANIFEL